MHERRVGIVESMGKSRPGGHPTRHGTDTRIAVAMHGTAAEDMADAAGTFAHQATHVFLRQNGVSVIGTAHGAAGVGVVDAAPVGANQSADIASATGTASGIRPSDAALVVAHQATDHFTRAFDRTGRIRSVDDGASLILPHQAANVAAIVNIEAGDIAAGAGIADNAGIEAGQPAHRAPTGDRGTAAHIVQCAAKVHAHQRAHILAARHAAALQDHVAHDTAFHLAKQANAGCRGRGGRIDLQSTDHVAGAVKCSRIASAIAAGDGGKTGILVPANRAAGVDVAGQHIVITHAQAAYPLQAENIGDAVWGEARPIAAVYAQETAVGDGEILGCKNWQARCALRPCSAVERERLAHLHGCRGGDAAGGAHTQIARQSQGSADTHVRAAAQLQGALRRQVAQVERPRHPQRSHERRAADVDVRCADGFQFRFGQTQRRQRVGRVATDIDGARLGIFAEQDRIA